MHELLQRVCQLRCDTRLVRAARGALAEAAQAGRALGGARSQPLQVVGQPRHHLLRDDGACGRVAVQGRERHGTRCTGTASRAAPMALSEVLGRMEDLEHVPPGCLALEARRHPPGRIVAWEGAWREAHPVRAPQLAQRRQEGRARRRRVQRELGPSDRGHSRQSPLECADHLLCNALAGLALEEPHLVPQLAHHPLLARRAAVPRHRGRDERLSLEEP